MDRFVYLKDTKLSRPGFADLATASKVAAELSAKYSGEEYRIRTRWRRRTGQYDVVVKRRTAYAEVLAKTVKAAEPPEGAS